MGHVCTYLINQKSYENVMIVNAFKSLQTTGALCKTATVTRGQLRLYEKEGLISPQSRTDAGYRQYSSETIDRLKVIFHLKELGLTLAEIALLLADRDQGVLDEKALQELASNVLAKINERIASLQVIRDYVEPVAIGDMRVLNEPECSFVVEFMTALKVTK
jgi:MerR family transcriptional regulator, copper efflux regulator